MSIVQLRENIIDIYIPILVCNTMGIRCILDHGGKMYLVKEPKHADLTYSVGLSSDEYGFVISVLQGTMSLLYWILNNMGFCFYYQFWTVTCYVLPVWWFLKGVKFVAWLYKVPNFLFFQWAIALIYVPLPGVAYIF